MGFWSEKCSDLASLHDIKRQKSRCLDLDALIVCGCFRHRLTEIHDQVEPVFSHSVFQEVFQFDGEMSDRAFEKRTICELRIESWRYRSLSIEGPRHGRPSQFRTQKWQMAGKLYAAFIGHCLHQLSDERLLSQHHGRPLKVYWTVCQPWWGALRGVKAVIIFQLRHLPEPI